MEKDEKDEKDRISVCVSAPGKVLITGGYLILDKKRKGIVISTSARFYTRVRTSKTASQEHQDRTRNTSIPFRVESVQFHECISGRIEQKAQGYHIQLRYFKLFTLPVLNTKYLNMPTL